VDIWLPQVPLIFGLTIIFLLQRTFPEAEWSVISSRNAWSFVGTKD
jgi:hypothetical protein